MTLILLNTTIKISLIVIAAMAAMSLLRRQSAAVRHFVLAAALACAAATPFVRFVAPAFLCGVWPGPIPPQMASFLCRYAVEF